MAGHPIMQFPEANQLSLLTALTTCMAAMLLGASPTVAGAAFVSTASGPALDPSAEAANANSEKMLLDFRTAASRLAGEYPSPTSPLTAAGTNNRAANYEDNAGDTDESDVEESYRAGYYPKAQTFPDDPDLFLVEPRNGGGTRLRFGKRTPPVGFNVRGTRLRFGKRSKNDFGTSYARARVQTRGARLRFGKRSGQRLRFGKRAGETTMDVPDFYDSPSPSLSLSLSPSPSPAEDSALYNRNMLNQDLDVLEDLGSSFSKTEPIDEADEDATELIRLLSNTYDKRAPSSRLRFGKKSVAFGSESGDKNVRLRFGKRAASSRSNGLDDGMEFFYGPTRLDLYKRPATRLRFGKRSVGDVVDETKQDLEASGYGDGDGDEGESVHFEMNKPSESSSRDRDLAETASGSSPGKAKTR